MCAVDGETDGPTGRLIEWKNRISERGGELCMLIGKVSGVIHGNNMVHNSKV